MDEALEDSFDWYLPPNCMEVADCPDIHLSKERQRELQDGQYLIMYYRLCSKREDVLRENFGICSDNELVFLDEGVAV